MASLFKMPGKPYWFLRVKIGGKWVKRSTGLRIDCPNDTATAREVRAKAEAAEYRRNAKDLSPTTGWDWAQDWLVAGRPKGTAIRYAGAWKWVGMWLTELHLDVPQVKYCHVEQYIEWRTGRRKRNTGKSAGRNTAIQEVKILATVLNEAVRRDMIPANPLASLKLQKEVPPTKRAFGDDEVDKMLSALEKEPEWMRVSFRIALATGCRLRETRIPLKCIDLDGAVATITFPTPKGGAKKAFTVPCPSSLLPMFREMQAEGRTHTIDAFPLQPSRAWQHFFKRAGIDDACFHCLRVTKVTRLRREGVPREVAMRLVNHSSELIHCLYDRHQVRDLAAWADYGIAGGGDATAQSHSTRPAH